MKAFNLQTLKFIRLLSELILLFMKKLISFFLFISLFINANAQELNCQIQVNYSQVQGTNQQVFQTLQASLYEFMNTTKWTDHVFNNDERIDCNILINVSEIQGSSRFVSTLSVQSRRPVYNTTYYTTLLNYQEKKGAFIFDYEENQSLDLNLNTYNSNLTSTLAFYAYIILGLDYDTFSQEGGTPYYQKAQQIVTAAQNASESGWKAFEGKRNRYWLVEDLLNSTYKPYRRCLYRYHRRGLDQMAEKTQAGSAEIAEGIRALERVHQSEPNSFLISLFVTAKSGEIIEIFQGSKSTSEKSRVIQVMKTIDPANANKYDKINSGG